MRQTALERPDLSCTYLAHHELESDIILVIVVVVFIIIIVIIIVVLNMVIISMTDCMNVRCLQKACSAAPKVISTA